MINAPIYGSQFNPPARLYKRFIPEAEFLFDDKTIECDKSLYRTYHAIPYTEADDKEKKELQPVKGLSADDGKFIIKFNGRYSEIRGAKDEPEYHDIICVRGVFWVVESVRRKKHKTLYNMATVYLILTEVQNEVILKNN